MTTLPGDAPGNNGSAIQALEHLVQQALSGLNTSLTIIGLCGAQGSGKSTLARALKERFDRNGVPTALLSIDDLYRTRVEREMLGRASHPLLRTRGVPRTHDIDLGLGIIASLERGEAAPLPRFDKAADDRLPDSAWEEAAPGTRLLLLEGWCVGARPQSEADLASPVNQLEREEDAEGIWRHFVNSALAGSYQALFARIDRLVFLAAPSFDVVLRWRNEQEEELRGRAPSPGVMSGKEIARFIQHYERLTRHMLDDLPRWADMVIELAEDRSVIAIRNRGGLL
ncbi:kinase [Sphingobium sp. EP60837]|uniref:kinase n=1 Tax=Sphingobium sp. EP60837 TaxID=1855519 RepID=UPI0007DE1EA2|nr:Glycerate 3-kinase [Sphingobium sp. EP60837]